MATAKENAAIQDLKTHVAVLKNDVQYIRKSLDDNASTSKTILALLNGGHFVTTKVFTDYVQSIDRRLKPTEDFLDKNKQGIQWSNSFVTKALSLLTLALIAAGLGLSVYKLVSLLGHG